MKKLLITLIAIIPFLSFSQSQDVEKQPVQIALITPLSTGKPTDSIIYHASLNMMAGYNYGIDGAELGGMFNGTRTNVHGAQIAGMVNWVGGTTHGLQSAGMFNRTKTLYGAQIGGLANSTETAQGAQLAGLFNRTKTLKGAQIAGLGNSAQTIDGTQIAGLVNQTNEVHGYQLSGLVNYAKKVDGSQVGIVNIADSVENGVSFGLFSFVKSGVHSLELSTNEVTHITVSFRTGTDRLYNIYSAGIQGKENALWMAGLGFGTRFPLKADKLHGSIEAVGYNVNSTSKFSTELNLLNRASFNMSYQLTDKVLINAGPVLNIYVARKEDPADAHYGYSLGYKSFYKEVSGGTMTKMWIGYQLGISF